MRNKFINEFMRFTLSMSKKVKTPVKIEKIVKKPERKNNKKQIKN